MSKIPEVPGYLIARSVGEIVDIDTNVWRVLIPGYNFYISMHETIDGQITVPVSEWYCGDI